MHRNQLHIRDLKDYCSEPLRKHEKMVKSREWFQMYHVCEFVSDDGGDSLFIPVRGHLAVVEQSCFSVRNQTPVLHRTGVKVRQSHLICTHRSNTIVYFNPESLQTIKLQDVFSVTHHMGIHCKHKIGLKVKTCKCRVM